MHSTVKINIHLTKRNFRINKKSKIDQIDEKMHK